ncbi:MAG: hypothetical protein ABI678_17875, partial [Kofleriaceae bacterium]
RWPTCSAAVRLALVPVIAIAAWLAWPRGAAAPTPDAAPVATPATRPADAAVPDAALVADAAVPADATRRPPVDASRTIHHVTRPKPDAGDDVDFYPAKP